MATVFPKTWNEFTPAIKMLDIVTGALVFMYFVRDLIGVIEEHGLRSQRVQSARLQPSFTALVTWALSAKFSDCNRSKPRLMCTFRLVRRL